MKVNQQQFWESLAKNDPDSAVIDPYDTSGRKNRYIVSTRNRTLLNHIRSINSSPHVLDFGCGSGMTTEHLYKNEISVVGIDISLTLLKKARSRIYGDYLNVLQYDGKSIPIESKTFDSIVTYVVLNHITNEGDLINIINELNRVLKTNGTIFAIEQTRRANKLSKDGSKKQLTIKNFEKNFIKCGFKLEDVRVIRFGHFPLIYLIKAGLIRKSWLSNLSSMESFIGKFYKVPLFDYADTLFILKKEG